jgi:ribosomal protein S18 acetylase RimI-like enzyme
MATSVSEHEFRELQSLEDVERIRRIVRSSGLFSEEEMRIARELALDRLEKGDRSDYRFLLILEPSMEGGPLNSSVMGYSCYGLIAGTQSSFDLYWIAVEKQIQGRGLGGILLRKTEELIGKCGGTRVYVETSSTGPYTPTRAFYEKNGYVKETVLKDFYRPGDSKVIYVKTRIGLVDDACPASGEPGGRGRIPDNERERRVVLGEALRR